MSLPSASTAPVASRPSGPPTFVLRPWKAAGDGALALYPIDGALMVADATRVGRIVDDGVEWIGEIPKTTPGLGGNSIFGVHGRWPDWVDALYQTDNGRAPAPTLLPIRGVGLQHTFSSGGGAGWLTGLATIGASTLAAGFSHGSHELVVLRGPPLERKQLSREDAGCTDEETAGWGGPAVIPYAFAATTGGTLMSVGHLCQKRPPVAEVWDQSPTSRIVELSKWVKTVDFETKLHPGAHDEMFLIAGPKGPLLRYRKGELTKLPVLERPLVTTFVSPKGELHASDGHSLYRLDAGPLDAGRLDAGRWTLVGHFAWPSHLRTLAFFATGFWGHFGGTIYRLEATDAPVVDDSCKTPFVYLYDVSPNNPADFAFPSTTKALSSFPGADRLSLVDVRIEGARRLGVVVTDRAEGERVVEHVKREMKDEHPELRCHVPVAPRRIPIPAPSDPKPTQPKPSKP